MRPDLPQALQAIPTNDAGGGLLRVVSNSDLAAAEQKADAERVAQEDSANATASPTGLAGLIRTEYEMMRRHRNDMMAGWNIRLLNSLRVFNGKYSPEQLAEIKKFGGSEVYARLTAVKCRGASSLLRDVYLGSDRPWSLDASEDPTVPDQVLGAINQLVMMEAQSAQQAGQQIDPMHIHDRMTSLIEAARVAARKNAIQQADTAEDKIDEMLRKGGFYGALAEFIVDLPMFPYACLKGPTVRIVPTVTWVGNTAQSSETPRLFWYRVSPFDVYWTPGVSGIEDASIIERQRLTRSDLNDLLDLPGYNAQEIREALDEYGRGGLSDDWDTTDAERAINESRENPLMNRSGLIACLEFHGNVQGRQLLDEGFDPALIPDPLRDYFIQAWLVGRHIIKVQLCPSPRKRHPYYVTSFEKVPGTPVGNGLPDILEDMQNVANATLRALVNNVSIASGPQVVINDDLLADDEDGEDLYPWKRWHVQSDPFGSNTQKPVDFFQPTSNAQELFGVYSQFTNIADELSAIPRYLTGSQAGAVGRTASGLAMLMGNASKILQTVAANIDRDVMEPLLTNLFDLLMLTDTSGLLTGEETVTVKGVNVAMQKETQRQRQLEFLQTTANPLDMQIIGPKGRAAVLRAVSQTIGLPGEEIVPSDDELQAQQQQAQQAAQAQGQPGHSLGGPQAAQAQGNKAPAPGDNGPRTNLQQRTQ